MLLVGYFTFHPKRPAKQIADVSLANKLQAASAEMDTKRFVITTNRTIHMETNGVIVLDGYPSILSTNFTAEMMASIDQWASNFLSSPLYRYRQFLSRCAADKSTAL